MSSFRPSWKGRRASEGQSGLRPQAKSSVRRIKDLVTQGVRPGATPQRRVHVVHPTSIKIDKDNYPGTARTYAELFVDSSQKPSQSRTSSVEERSRQYRTSVEAKTQEKRAQQLAEETRECTFTPKVNSTKGPPRNSQEFFEDMMKFETRKRNRLQQLRLEVTADESTADFQPTINDTSKKIASARNASQCHERLFELTKGKFTEYQPVEHMHNHQQPRLFAADLSRKRVFVPVPEACPQPAQASKRSNRMLVSKFRRQFAQAKKEVDLDASDQLNYTRFVQMFDTLQFLGRNESSTDLEAVAKLWSTLGSHFYEDLEVLMLGVLGYYEPWMDNRPGFTLNAKQVPRLHRQYKQLWSNRAGLTTARGRSLNTKEATAAKKPRRPAWSKAQNNELPELLLPETPFDLESVSSIGMDQNLPESSKNSLLACTRGLAEARSPLRESQEVFLSECNDA